MAGGWRIRHKLILGMGLVGAVMALLLAGTLKGLASYRATRQTMESKLEELKRAVELRQYASILVVPCKDTLGQAGEMRSRLKSVEKALGEYDIALQLTLLQNRDPGHGFRVTPQVQGVREKLAEFEKALAVAEQPTILKPWDTVQLPFVLRPKSDEVIQASVDLIDAINLDLQSRLNAAKKDYTISFAIVISTSAFAVLLLAGLLRFFYRWVHHPIRDLESGVSRVAQGDFEHAIEIHSGDEIEDLAKAFNDMTSRLREMYRDLAQQVNERSRQLVRSERLAGVGFLAAGVAHEINNPLAGIAFCSEALKRRLTELFSPGNFKEQMAAGTQQEREIFTKYLNMIEEEAFRCKNITQKLLAFSRGGEKRREPTNMGDLVQSVVDMVQHHDTCKGKDLVFQPAQQIEAWVNGQEVKQVFLNLVMNALDSMDEGGRLTITQHMKAGMVETVFQDTGCGMSGDVLENIFEPFYTRSRSGKGTGLGLSISHQIITQHNGDIEANSGGLNKGSTFIVRLPLKPPADQTGDHEEQDPPEVEFKKFAQKRRKAA
ncbi:MAG: ATP-binding protein [Gemmataceae bacterium]